VTRSGVWSCLIAAVLFGASTPAASVIADDMTPLVLAGLLYLGAAIVVAPWWLTRPPDRAALRRDRASLAVAIVAGGAVGPALLTAGLVDTPAATASLLLNMELVATVVLAATLFREHLGRNMLVAAALVTVAGALLVWEPGATANLSALLIVGACVCWGLDNSVTSRIDQVSPQHVTFLKGIVAGSVNLVLGLAISGVGDVGVWSVLGALVVGAFGYGVSITLWVRGAHQLGAARGQVIFATAPFIGAVLSWALLSEPVAVVQIVAMAIAACGVAISLRSAHQHQHHHHATQHTHEHDHTDGHHDHVHADGFSGRHSHVHEHAAVVHSHPHVPDLHHRHEH
jgi:drug/metabolite transporter (DMT)-like permease